MQQQHIENIIVPFNMLYYLEFGLLDIINKEYHNDKYFNFDIFKNPDRRILYELICRIKLNPISLIIKDSSLEIDNLYKDILTKHYEEIVRNSYKTKICDMIEMSSDTNNVVRFNILYSSDFEKKVLDSDSIFDKANKVSILDHRLYDIISYYNIFDIIPDYEKLKGKNVFVANVRHNFVRYEDKLSIPIEVDLLIRNKVKLTYIDLFNFNS